MKALRDLRPCDACGGPLSGGLFYVLRFSLAVVSSRAVQEFQGMHLFFGSRASFELVENFSPSAMDAVTVAMDSPEHKSLMTELVICADCYMKPLDLPVLAERRTYAIERAAEAKATA